MCNLTGVAGTINHEHLAAFTQLLLVGQLRGVDSTGVAAIIANNNTYEIFKRPLNAVDFIGMPKYDKTLRWNTSVIIGHNRHATVGKVNSANSHPFDWEHIIGAHNGTLTNKHALEDAHQFGTDSETLFYNFALKSPMEVIPNISGAWALTWYDGKYKRINFLRNKERSLAYTFANDYKTLFWASEPAFLSLILRRCEIPYEKIFQFPTDTLRSYLVPEDNQPFLKKDMMSIHLEGKTITYYTAPYTPATQDCNPNGMFPHRYGNTAANNKGRSDEIKGGLTVVPSEKLPVTSENVMASTVLGVKPQPSIEDQVAVFRENKILKEEQERKALKGKKGKATYRWYKGEEISKEEFDKRTKDGCSWCTADILWGEPLKFIDRETFKCKDCIKLENINDVKEGHTYN